MVELLRLWLFLLELLLLLCLLGMLADDISAAGEQLTGGLLDLKRLSSVVS